MKSLWAGLPDGGEVTVDVNDVEVRHGGVAGRLARLVLVLVQVRPLGVRVEAQHLSRDKRKHGQFGTDARLTYR